MQGAGASVDSDSKKAALRLLSEVCQMQPSTEQLVENAIELAGHVLHIAEGHTQKRDREQAQVLSRMMLDERGQVFTTLLTDRAYRSSSMKRTVEQARYLLERVGPPEYLGPLQRLGLGALRSVGSWLPTLSGTAMLDRIEEETSAFILPAGKGLAEYLDKRRGEGVRVNVNHLGEEVLSEDEAEARVEGYIELLRRPGIDVLSVKVSSIFSQLTPLAHDGALEIVGNRLRRIYRAAASHRNEEHQPKLVTLDMESYQDARLTLDVFMRVLSEPEFVELKAGIALQAYLPDTSAWHEELLSWARERVAAGGAPIRTRIVKGANLEMERVTAAVAGWDCPIYPSKSEVDAHYKRTLLRACQPENARAAEVGIASHNLFDVCFGLLLRERHDVSEHVSFELLEGMADPLRRALRELAVDVLVYAPVVHDHEFPSAIAYLVRRLDENTSPSNYLRNSFGMRQDSEAWKLEVARFREAGALIERVSTTPRRQQDRRQDSITLPLDAPFGNAADTDFSLTHNREHFISWLEATREKSFQVCSVIAGERLDDGQQDAGFDPSRPGYVPYQVSLASAEDVTNALACAASTFEAEEVPAEARQQWLSAAARCLADARAELVALMALDAGKRPEESDVEVSEAIDFAQYYLRCHREMLLAQGISVAPKGPVVVTPPWNFPLAIPLGGVFAALVAGNPVILKPALETPLVAQRAVELLWEAGIPKSWLQFVVCRDEVASSLITDPRTRVVVLTGATSTARKFQNMRPDLDLLAETGGKNALYVSAMSDHEQAVVEVVASAFGHAGQKCSALSQLILDAELYDSVEFLGLLAAATRSLAVGSAWDPLTRVTPLILPPNELHRRALTQLEEGESWLVEPSFDPANPRLVSPGIKLGVQPGSFSHTTEFFCPVLGVLRARDVAHAVRIANQVEYGLTAGIHSLDEREHEVFIDGIDAGNVYINRRITGAIVRRQPFGGWKASSFGPGSKAGGPNYVREFVHIHDAEGITSARPKWANADRALTPRVESVLRRLQPHLGSQLFDELLVVAERYERGHTHWFSSPHDASAVRGEDNLFRYRPLRSMLVVCDAALDARGLSMIVLGAAVAECAVELVLTPESSIAKLAVRLGAKAVADEAALCSAIEESAAERVRMLGDVTDAVRAAAQRKHAHVITEEPLRAPRWELLHYLREQAVSIRYHRYGHLGLRSRSEHEPGPPVSRPA